MCQVDSEFFLAYYHEVEVAGNVLLLITVHGARCTVHGTRCLYGFCTISFRYLSVCLSVCIRIRIRIRLFNRHVRMQAST